MMANTQERSSGGHWYGEQKIMDDLRVINFSQQVHTLLADVTRIYRRHLQTAPKAIQYLRDRGISDRAVARYGLGFAPNDWHNLADILSRYPREVIQASGLCVAKGEVAFARRYDFFRDRIMFPLRSLQGNIIGFGGRRLGDTGPKYINSQESQVFQKRKHLFGLYEAQETIGAEGRAVVVEGYLDVVSVAQAGFEAVVGTLGTASNRYQVAELLGFVPRIVFCFDGDAAGRRAAIQAMENVLPFAWDWCSFEFAFLAEGEDPDSFVRKYGIGAFRQIIDSAMSLSDFLQQSITGPTDCRFMDGRALCASRCLAYWEKLPTGKTQDDLLEFCAELTGLSKRGILDVWQHRMGE